MKLLEEELLVLKKLLEKIKFKTFYHELHNQSKKIY